MTEIRLGDASQKIGSGATPRGGKEVYLSSGKTAFIRSQNIYNNRFEKTGVVYLTDEQANDLSNVEVLPNDVLLNITGDSVARACQVPSEILPARVNQHVAIIRTIPQKLDSRFLSYFLVSPVMQSCMLSMASAGATRQALTKGMIENFRIPQFELEKQKAIASILGALDDKIELSRRMNATLEAMALALFKSWFVDFDPVRAKSEGHHPFGMDAETVALFPSRLVPSTLGDIPVGWTVDEIGNVVTAVGGSTPSTENPEYWIGGQHAWATPKDLSALKSPVLLSTERRITDAGIRVISSGLLPSGTVLMSSRAPIGYIAIAETPVAINQGFIAITCNKSLPNLYVWQWLQTNLDMIKSHANGSTFQEISKGSFRPLPCIVPESKVLEKFQAIVLPIWQKLVTNEKERLGLEKTRDYLLPKLISGDIRISDAEKFVEAA
jgi:type I restriction enzyme S subunit